MIDFEVRGAQRTIRKLDAFDGRGILKYGQRTSANYARIVLTTYPPLPPGSTYIRKYRIEREWRVVETGDDVRLVNGLPFIKWVQGTKTQARIHRGRWRTLGQVMQEAGKVGRRAALDRLHSWTVS